MEYDNVDYEILLKVSSHVTNGWTWREDGKIVRKWKKSSLTSSLHYYRFLIKWAPDWSYIVEVIDENLKLCCEFF